MSKQDKQILKELLQLLIVCQLYKYQDFDKVIDKAVETLSLMINTSEVEA